MRLHILSEIYQDSPVSDIRRTLTYRADMFGDPFSNCLQQALRGPSDWRIGERELFASFTASLLQCTY
ncbi:hypothetical protein KTT_56850 [Tengunoibacter tsumagoiensis]|uniref:Uncharacterized protein n=2 Tax=Tengunoibacter tsumagoiensis TaxID=2014871 RepID=A0A402A9X6_9CHLR|nr:hypothetical protein KTT_56850 [Tengunoibacter tsumagoiensis]